MWDNIIISYKDAGEIIFKYTIEKKFTVDPYNNFGHNRS